MAANLSPKQQVSSLLPRNPAHSRTPEQSARFASDVANPVEGPDALQANPSVSLPQLERSLHSVLRRAADSSDAHQQMHALVDLMEATGQLNGTEASAAGRLLSELIEQGNSATPAALRTDGAVLYVAVLAARRLSEEPEAVAAMDPEVKRGLHTALVSLKVHGEFGLIKAAERASLALDPYV